MADFKQNYFQRRTKDRGPRSNNRISSPEVQVIGSDGENLGVISTNEAISMARNQGLDLIEIAPNAKPPICKIMDMQCTNTNGEETHKRKAMEKGRKSFGLYLPTSGPRATSPFPAGVLVDRAPELADEIGLGRRRQKRTREPI